MEKSLSEAIVSLHTARYLSFRYLLFQDVARRAVESAIYLTIDLEKGEWLGLSDILEINIFLAACVLKCYLKDNAPGICLSHSALLRQTSMIEKVLKACSSCTSNAGASKNGFYLKKNEMVLVMEDISSSSTALVEIPVEQKALIPYLKVDKW